MSDVTKDITDPEANQPKTAPPPAEKAPDPQAHAQAEAAGDSNEPLPGGDVKADHAMDEETQLGWDQAPVEKDGPDARHPRQKGQGGTLEDGQEWHKSSDPDLSDPTERDADHA